MDTTPEKNLIHWLWIAFAGLLLTVLVMLAVLGLSIWNALFGLRATPPPVALVTLTATRPTDVFRPSATRTPFQPLPPTTRTPRPTRTPPPTHTLPPTEVPTVKPTRKPTRTPTQTYEPLPTDAGQPQEIPASAQISGVYGDAQISTLDCEARSAVDWAEFFSIGIDEVEFLDSLPSSDNPETGFVGVYWGSQGGLPPASYGIHAAPVAALLRAYGLPAYEWKGMTWDELRREIAAGRPVITWVIGNVYPGGQPVEYTASDGQTVIVARLEHTVIITGYDEDYVTVADGAMVYRRAIRTFLDSWSVLGNMAITAADLNETGSQ